MKGIFWFREDLRIIDNTALYHATLKCDEGLLAIYIFDHEMITNHSVAICRVEFMLRGLVVLQKQLMDLGIPLLVIEIKNTKNIADTINAIIEKHKINALFFNRQHEWNELNRDKKITKYMKDRDIECFSYDDQTILSPGAIKNQSGEDFKVFTAYKRSWLKHFSSFSSHKLLKPIPIRKKLVVSANPIPQKILSLNSNVSETLWPAGEQVARRKLKHFISNSLFSYDQQRDFPGIDGTSRLSPYLASGMISPRECFYAAFIANQHQADSGNKGALCWMGELIWREFYKNILIAFPRVSKNRAYKPETEKIIWNQNEIHFQAWQQGQTGFPLIDAAMRQLNTTGWMHNRLRMVVAMFLSKNLLLDWRTGERYFMQHLIDGDLSANNGGWQWCASTGTDSVPYFRVFNPIRQSMRFDPDGVFIKRYCPELNVLNGKSIHDPFVKAPEIMVELGYPLPIVNLKMSRDRVLAAFKKIS